MYKSRLPQILQTHFFYDAFQEKLSKPFPLCTAAFQTRKSNDPDWAFKMGLAFCSKRRKRLLRFSDLKDTPN